MHIASSFYLAQLIAVFVWSLLLRITTRKHLHELCNGSVYTRPSWLPAPFLRLLLEHKQPVVIGLPIALIIGFLVAEHMAVRLMVALAVSMYHLVETAFTSRHGEYPVLWCAWAMVLPAPYSQAAALGVATNFVLQCGVAKCMIGGARQWAAPGTMSVYLNVYFNSKTSRPLSRALNRLLVRFDGLVGLLTILLEVVLIPAALFLPAPLRYVVGVWGMIALHIGIAFGMSLRVGLVFLTTLPTYITGFGCDARVGSTEWCLAAAIALGPSAIAIVRGRLLSEEWPCTPCSLFMYNGAQAGRLARLAMTGTMRIAMATREVGEMPEQSLIGLPVAHHGGTAAFGLGHGGHDGPRMHDSVLRVLGFTLVHGGLVDAFDIASPEEENVRRLLPRLERWLRTERRLVETASGRPLERAYWVRINEKTQTVEEVCMVAAR